MWVPFDNAPAYEPPRTAPSAKTGTRQDKRSLPASGQGRAGTKRHPAECRASGRRLSAAALSLAGSVLEERVHGTRGQRAGDWTLLTRSNDFQAYRDFPTCISGCPEPAGFPAWWCTPRGTGRVGSAAACGTHQHISHSDCPIGNVRWQKHLQALRHQNDGAIQDVGVLQGTRTGSSR